MKSIVATLVGMISMTAVAHEQCTKKIGSYAGSKNGTTCSIDVIQSEDAKGRIYDSRDLRDYQKNEFYDLINHKSLIILLQDCDAGIYGSAHLILLSPRTCKEVKRATLWTD